MTERHNRAKTKSWTAALSIALVTGWSTPDTIVGMQVQVIDSEPTCAECRIVLTPVVSLGDSVGPGVIGGLSTIAQLQDGRYVLSYHQLDDELLVFSRDGRYLQSVGRRGRGPGEFEFIHWVRAQGDKIYVFDPHLRRQTVYSLDFHVIRTSPFEGEALADVEVVDDSTVVMNARIWSRERAGFLLHAFDRAGNVRVSFDEDSAGMQYDVPVEVYLRRLAKSSSGGIWSSHWTRYRIDEWSLDGTLQRSILRKAEWFPEHRGDGAGILDPRTPPRPRLKHVRESDGGRLWTFTTVAAHDWARALVPADRSDHPEARKYTIGDLNRAYDTIVEVLDLRTGTVLVTTRLDQYFVGYLDDQVVSSSQAPDGTWRLHIWRVSLYEPQQRRTR